jgi:ABC-type multidrug transport system ATPase subunit
VRPDAPATSCLLLQRLRACGHAVVLCSHDLEEVGGLADSLAVMRGGCLVARGTPPQLKAALGPEYSLTLLLQLPSALPSHHHQQRPAAPAGGAAGLRGSPQQPDATGVDGVAVVRGSDTWHSAAHQMHDIISNALARGGPAAGGGGRVEPERASEVELLYR